MEIAESLCESFYHNLNRIKNCFSLGYYLEGGGSLELELASDLKERASNKFIKSLYEPQRQN